MKLDKVWRHGGSRIELQFLTTAGGFNLNILILGHAVLVPTCCQAACMLADGSVAQTRRLRPINGG